jgi:hypothetical protein
MLVGRFFILQSFYGKLIIHISVARHAAEHISSQRPMLLFLFLLQLLRSASDSAGAIPRNGFQFSNSQVQEREGSGLSPKNQVSPHVF